METFAIVSGSVTAMQYVLKYMYHVGGVHACAKDAAHIYGVKSSSGMMQLWPLHTYTLGLTRFKIIKMSTK
jgi:hypothetical protein